MFRFRYPIRGISLFFNAGISNGLFINEINYLKQTVEIPNIIPIIKEGSAIGATRKYEQGYVVGLGIKLKKISFETRYERGNGMSGYKTLGSAVTRYYFLAGYRF